MDSRWTSRTGSWNKTAEQDGQPCSRFSQRCYKAAKRARPRRGKRQAGRQIALIWRETTETETDTTVKIGQTELKNNLILAPMAGVSDLPFRMLCAEQGAGLVCMEMVSAKAILFHNRNTEELMRSDEKERPVSLQLFGSDPQIISEMAEQIEEKPFDILDLNMGCPVPKVVRNGEGSALMRDPELAARIVRETVKRIRKPVTVKFRKGFNDREVNAVEFAKRLEDAGAAAVTVHGRTREQYYAGKADWDIIRAVKEAVSIPVIGNGDVTDPASARALQDYTGSGRPAISEVRNMILRHAQMAVELKGEYTGIREMRKHVAWYTTGFRNASVLRGASNRICTLADLNELLLTLPDV